MPKTRCVLVNSNYGFRRSSFCNLKRGTTQRLANYRKCCRICTRENSPVILHRNLTTFWRNPCSGYNKRKTTHERRPAKHESYPKRYETTVFRGQRTFFIILSILTRGGQHAYFISHVGEVGHARSQSPCSCRCAGSEPAGRPPRP